MGAKNQLSIICYKNKKSSLEQKVLKDMLLDLVWETTSESNC